MAETKRMTVSQALIEFLAHQWTVDGDVRERTIPGVFGIFGHGNVAGIGQALTQLNVHDPDLMPYHQARNEQAMVHQAVGYARMHRRRGTYVAAASVGPGAANMLTGAALATTNRLPALLLPSDQVRAFRLFKLALLVDLLFGQIFSFTVNQFGAVFALGVDLFLLAVVTAEYRRLCRRQPSDR